MILLSVALLQCVALDPFNDTSLVIQSGHAARSWARYNGNKNITCHDPINTIPYNLNLSILYMYLVNYSSSENVSLVQNETHFTICTSFSFTEENASDPLTFYRIENDFLTRCNSYDGSSSPTVAPTSVPTPDYSDGYGPLDNKLINATHFYNASMTHQNDSSWILVRYHVVCTLNVFFGNGNYFNEINESILYSDVYTSGNGGDQLFACPGTRTELNLLKTKHVIGNCTVCGSKDVGIVAMWCDNVNACDSTYDSALVRLHKFDASCPLGLYDNYCPDMYASGLEAKKDYTQIATRTNFTARPCWTFDDETVTCSENPQSILIETSIESVSGSNCALDGRFGNFTNTTLPLLGYVNYTRATQSFIYNCRSDTSNSKLDAVLTDLQNAILGFVNRNRTMWTTSPEAATHWLVNGLVTNTHDVSLNHIDAVNNQSRYLARNFPRTYTRSVLQHGLNLQSTSTSGSDGLGDSSNTPGTGSDSPGTGSDSPGTGSDGLGDSSDSLQESSNTLGTASYVFAGMYATHNVSALFIKGDCTYRNYSFAEMFRQDKSDDHVLYESQESEGLLYSEYRCVVFVYLSNQDGFRDGPVFAAKQISPTGTCSSSSNGSSFTDPLDPHLRVSGWTVNAILQRTHLQRQLNLLANYPSNGGNSGDTSCRGCTDNACPNNIISICKSAAEDYFNTTAVRITHVPWLDHPIGDSLSDAYCSINMTKASDLLNQQSFVHDKELLLLKYGLVFDIDEKHVHVKDGSEFRRIDTTYLLLPNITFTDTTLTFVELATEVQELFWRVFVEKRTEEECTGTYHFNGGTVGVSWQKYNKEDHVGCQGIDGCSDIDSASNNDNVLTNSNSVDSLSCELYPGCFRIKNEADVVPSPPITFPPTRTLHPTTPPDYSAQFDVDKSNERSQVVSAVLMSVIVFLFVAVFIVLHMCGIINDSDDIETEALIP